MLAIRAAKITFCIVETSKLATDPCEDIFKIKSCTCFYPRSTLDLHEKRVTLVAKPFAYPARPRVVGSRRVSSVHPSICIHTDKRWRKITQSVLALLVVSVKEDRERTRE